MAAPPRLLKLLVSGGREEAHAQLHVTQPGQSSRGSSGEWCRRDTDWLCWQAGAPAPTGNVWLGSACCHMALHGAKPPDDAARPQWPGVVVGHGDECAGHCSAWGYECLLGGGAGAGLLKLTVQFPALSLRVQRACRQAHKPSACSGGHADSGELHQPRARCCACHPAARDDARSSASLASTRRLAPRRRPAAPDGAVSPSPGLPAVTASPRGSP